MNRPRANLRRRLRQLAVAGLLLTAGATAAESSTASANLVPNRLVCSTTTNRCYQSNGRFDARYPCQHAYNVNWAITSPWPTYSTWRGTLCKAGWL